MPETASQEESSPIRETHSMPAIMHDGPSVLIGLFAVSLAAIEILVDLTTWIGLNVSIVYSLPLVVASAVRDRRLLWILAAVLTAATCSVYFFQRTEANFNSQDPYLIDRLLACITLFMTASLLHVLMRARDALESQDRSLNEQNERLSLTNLELANSRHSIARQNAELEDRRRQAEEASMRKTRMLASLSHDVRTPLQAITTTAEVLQASAIRPELVAKIPHLAQRIRANAQAMVEMLSEVIDDSTLESGRLHLNKRRFALDELLSEEAHRLMPLAQVKNLGLEVEPLSEPLVLSTDRMKLARILGNLLSNAIKFTDTGTVTLSARLSTDGHVLICVRDTGRGIDQEDLKTIFDEFSQVSESRHSIAIGWGLGLSICHRLVTLIGGEITVKSRVGEGSVFTVHLEDSCIARPNQALAEESGSRTHTGPSDGPHRV
jgi:signal transduction histidine kinase